MISTYNRRIYKAAGNSCAVWCRCFVAAFFFLRAQRNFCFARNGSLRIAPNERERVESASSTWRK